MTNLGKIDVQAMVRRLADGAAAAVAQAKQRLARTDTAVTRIKAEVRTRRGLLDKALRRKRAK